MFFTYQEPIDWRHKQRFDEEYARMMQKAAERNLAPNMKAMTEAEQAVWIRRQYTELAKLLGNPPPIPYSVDDPR